MRARKPGAAVSAKRLAEAGSQLSRELLEATLDLVPAPIVLVEPAGAEVRFANRAADELAGGEFPRGATAGRHPWTDERGEPVTDDELPTVGVARLRDHAAHGGVARGPRTRRLVPDRHHRTRRPQRAAARDRPRRPRQGALRVGARRALSAAPGRAGTRHADARGRGGGLSGH